MARAAQAWNVRQGQWSDGDPLPSSYELTELYGMSMRTNRDAIIGLAAIGRAIKQHGKLTRAYMPSMELHRLVVARRESSPVPLVGVAEPDLAEADPAIQFIPGSGWDEVYLRWHEDEFVVPEWDAERLGIYAGKVLRTYTQTLSRGDERLLTSTSLVSPDLRDGPATWREKPIGELALAGVSTLYDRATVHSRIPTLNESKALHSVPSVPVFAVYRQCRVTPVATLEPPRRACVLVVARADRVHLTP